MNQTGRNSCLSTWLVSCHGCMVTPGLQNAVILGTKTAMEHMSVNRGGKGGVVINMSSIAGTEIVLCDREHPYTCSLSIAGIYPLQASTYKVYCASKAGVIAYTRSSMKAGAVGISAIHDGHENVLTYAESY